MIGLVGDSADLVFALIRRHGIECDAVQAGWLHPAHAKSKLPWLESLHRQWAKAGFPVRLLDRAGTAGLSGSDRFHSALLAPSGGQLNPLSLVRGLAERAIALGAAVHGGTPVRSVARDGGTWRLACAAGTVAAERVFLCTNAMTGALSPPLAQSTLPLEVYQMATAPLDDGRQACILVDVHSVLRKSVKPR